MMEVVPLEKLLTVFFASQTQPQKTDKGMMWARNIEDYIYENDAQKEVCQKFITE